MEHQFHYCTTEVPNNTICPKARQPGGYLNETPSYEYYHYLEEEQMDQWLRELITTFDLYTKETTETQ